MKSEMLKRIASSVIALGMIFSLATFAFGQGKKAPAERSVTGVVTDATGAPVPGAVIQLKNMKTMQVRSFIAREKGDYYFHGLGTDVDYELKAQKDGHDSQPHTLSSFDSHAEAVINLQLK
jgi:Carboxypeptidase regulatory-like domain